MYNPCETCNMCFKLDIKQEETCEHVGDIHEVDQFICSECGIHLEDWVRVKYDEDFYPQEKYFLEYSFKYCPNCGRKIVGY